MDGSTSKKGASYDFREPAAMAKDRRIETTRNGQ
jgi:hypothetical protein